MDQLEKKLSIYGDLETQVPLSTLTTLRIGGIARAVSYPKNLLALNEIMAILEQENIPFKLFGKGSNLLCSDSEYNGVILKLDRYMDDFYFTEHHCIAYAGCSIITLSYEAMKYSLSGLEFASGIPGTVGGVTYMNAGAYKSHMADVIESVFVYRHRRFEWISNEECQFGYRTSVFHQHPDWIILAVKFKLVSEKQEVIRTLLDNRRERRMQSQPLDKPSAGSVFRNNTNNPAWKIIDELGYRGKSVGGAQVSTKHVNFIVNANEATAADFMKLVEQIQRDAKEKMNEELVMELERFNW